MPDLSNSRFTARLRLEPAGPANARDLWLVHNDDEVAQWYGGWKPSLQEAEQRPKFWGLGYASEIGRAGLEFAFDVLGMQAVVSCTVRHNVRSRAVMERIGMRYAGEIRSRGMVEGLEGEQDDAPFAVCVLLRRGDSSTHAVSSSFGIGQSGNG